MKNVVNSRWFKVILTITCLAIPGGMTCLVLWKVGKRFLQHRAAVVCTLPIGEA